MPDETTSSSRTIPIHCETDTELIPEFAMIELNGELISPVELPSKKDSETILGTKDKAELGKLSLASDKNPTFILGSHQLKGKTEKLKEPFSLMEKTYDENQELSYRVIGIVKQKFIFNQYPKVIMR